MAAPEITDATFKSEILDHKGAAFVDFHAEWCGPCKVMGPVVDKFAEEYKGKIKIVKMDVDANPETAQSFGVLSIPTSVYLKDGQEVDRTIGWLGGTTLKEKLEALL